MQYRKVHTTTHESETEQPWIKGRNFIVKVFMNHFTDRNTPEVVWVESDRPLHYIWPTVGFRVEQANISCTRESNMSLISKEPS